MGKYKKTGEDSLNKISLSQLYEKLVETITQVVVRWYDPNNQTYKIGTGNGFLYNYKGQVYIITNYHVVFKSTINDPYVEIYTNITNVNGVSGDNRMFGIHIVGTDPISDIAVCTFNDCNENIPKAETSTSVKFFDSRKEKPGNTCFTIGNPLNTDSRSITSGVIRDEKFMGTNGIFIQEQITTDLIIYPSQSGSPIYNKNGHVIGINTFDYTVTEPDSTNQIAPGFGGGCSSHMMKPIIHKLLKHEQATKIESLNLPSPFYVFRKPYLGEYVWKGVIPSNLALIYPGTCKNLPIKGIIITFINPLVNNIFDKPKKGLPIKLGDIITAVQAPNGKFVEIGTYDNQYAIGSVLWQYDPACRPVVKFKVIHSPSVNTEESISSFVLDMTYPADKDVAPAGDIVLLTGGTQTGGMLAPITADYLQSLDAYDKLVNMENFMFIPANVPYGADTLVNQQTGLRDKGWFGTSYDINTLSIPFTIKAGETVSVPNVPIEAIDENNNIVTLTVNTMIFTFNQFNCTAVWSFGNEGTLDGPEYEVYKFSNFSYVAPHVDSGYALAANYTFKGTLDNGAFASFFLNVSNSVYDLCTLINVPVILMNQNPPKHLIFMENGNYVFEEQKTRYGDTYWLYTNAAADKATLYVIWVN